jgi:NADH pyrophosphatase NudC (nudix superfamily)
MRVSYSVNLQKAKWRARFCGNCGGSHVLRKAGAEGKAQQFELVGDHPTEVAGGYAEAMPTATCKFATHACRNRLYRKIRLH